MSKIRINGLVKLMNEVRESLSVGIPPGKEEEFRRMLRENLRQVDEICRAYKSSPEKLPTPSYQAYRYLKELDLQHLPVMKSALPAPPARLRVRNLIAACKRLQEELSKLAESNRKRKASLTVRDARVLDLLAHIRNLAQTVEQMTAKAGCGPGGLSSQSQKAYHWLSFLSEAPNLERHLATLHMALAEIKALQQGPKIRSRLANLPVRIELYNLPAIYRISQQKERLLIEAQEGFAGAPKEVIQALLWIALVGKSRSHLNKIKTYARSEAFRKNFPAREQNRSTPATRSKGQNFDLQEVFERVNQAYFDGQIEKPTLLWNKTLTQRKFGHYQASSDSLMISISLDKPGVPDYVIDFVMYHELLHKQVGVVASHGRRYAHTKAFRAAEARFPQRQQAQDYLNEISTKLSRGTSWKSKKSSFS